MIKTVLKSGYSKYILFSFIPVIISTFAVFFASTEESYKWLRMIWNYFLAVLPVYMALFAKEFSLKNKRIPKVIFMILWLLFFPNAVYMISDFKYLGQFDFEVWSYNSIVGSNMNYSSTDSNVALWLLLINLIITVFLGVLAGQMSLNIIHKLLKERFSSKVCWVIIVLVSILSAFGIYIGRFARLNSWDILFPWKLFKEILSVMTPFAPVFVLIISLCSITLYVGYYFFIRIINSVES